MWRTLLGDHPVTHALPHGTVTSASLPLVFADVAVPNKAFKRVVRDLEFDVAELALMTFLMARSRGAPLRLLPFVVFSRNPLPHVICRAEPAALRPADLARRRVGVRAYTTTTAVWVRALLDDVYGVNAGTIEWVTCEEGHVAGMREPANVRRAASDRSLVELLLEGAIDAAIVDPVPRDARIAPVVPDADVAYRLWQDTAFKNQPQRYVPRGIAPRRLDHVNLLAREVGPTRRLFHELLGLRLTEQIVFDDGTEVGAWLSATNKSYDVAITKDRGGAAGRLHHLTYMMDSREDVLRAADILVDAGSTIETGPHKHNIGQTFFLYCYEPGGNRFEIGAGGYLILDPDWQPVVWSQAERSRGQAWGLQTVSSFHTYGTPPVPSDSEPER